jgi:hydroxymethylpyrimidine/phosphomethylpyrimidine kinase
VTAQNSLGVIHIESISGNSVCKQIEAVLADLLIPSLKTGMLYSSETIKSVADALRLFDGLIVVDPVMVSRSGSKLLSSNAVAKYQEHLFPLTTLLTPNIHEASLLTGQVINNKDDVEHAAQHLLEQGPKSVLIKGGGLPDLAGQDYFCTSDNFCEWRSHLAIKTPHTHGTGCTLSSAITAALAQGVTLAEAVTEAKVYLEKTLLQPVAFGEGPGCVGHKIEKENN